MGARLLLAAVRVWRRRNFEVHDNMDFFLAISLLHGALGFVQLLHAGVRGRLGLGFEKDI
jgi:hypothetical protein